MFHNETRRVLNLIIAYFKPMLVIGPWGYILIFFNVFLSSLLGFAFNPQIPSCPQAGTRKVRVRVPITAGPGAGGYRIQTREEPIPMPECSFGEDVSTNRSCRKLAQCSFDTLRYYSRGIDTWGASYLEQLVNQDPVSAPQQMTKVNQSVSVLNQTGSEVDLDAIMASPSGSEEEEVYLREYRDMVFRGRANGYEDLHYSAPELPRIIATRLPYYQERAQEAIDGALLYSQDREITFGNMTPAAHRPSQLNYPTESAASNEMLRCTTGGFFNRAQQLEFVPNPQTAHLSTHKRTHFFVERTNGRPTSRYEVRSVNILTSRQNNQLQTNSPGQHECNTPNKVRLSLNGRMMDFSCNPARVVNDNDDDPNTAKAADGQRMCDPILYGFIPKEIEADTKANLTACHHPRGDQIGRFGSYTETIAGRVGTEVLHSLPQTKSMGMAMICPGCMQDKEIESKCDRMARLDIAPKVKVPNELKDIRGDFLLAAQLALENPNVWAHKVRRFGEYCNSMQRNREKENCNTIGRRMDMIQTVIERLKAITPEQPSELMSGRVQSDSAG